MYMIKPLDTSYKEMELIESEVWPNSYETAESLQHEYDFPEGVYYRHFVLEHAGETVGHGFVVQAYWVDAPGRYRIEVAIRPKFQSRGFGKTMYAFLLDHLAKRNPQYFYAYSREDKPRALRFLLERGFSQTQRNPVSRLDLTAFDFATYQTKLQRVAESGLRVVTLRELRETDPNWLDKLFEMRWQVLQDIPRTFEPKRGTVDAFVKAEIERPDVSADMWFIALDGDRYVGYSFYWLSTIDPQKIYTAVTGVVRSHRKKGVATALKMAGFRAAQTRSITEIETDNDESNPMYQINLRMGFVPQPAWLTWEKSVVSDDD
jgi:GNAT superfamily N-acetyltransferase